MQLNTFFWVQCQVMLLTPLRPWPWLLEKTQPQSDLTVEPLFQTDKRSSQTGKLSPCGAGNVGFSLINKKILLPQAKWSPAVSYLWQGNHNIVLIYLQHLPTLTELFWVPTRLFWHFDDINLYKEKRQENRVFKILVPGSSVLKSQTPAH